MNFISNILNHPENGLLNGLSHLLKKTVLDSGKDGDGTGVAVLEREGDMLSIKGPSFNISMGDYAGGDIAFKKISNLYEVDVEHGQNSVPGLFTGSIDFTGKDHPLVSVLSHKENVTPGDTFTVHFQTLTENQLGQLSRELPLTTPSQFGTLLNPQNQSLTETQLYLTNLLHSHALTVGANGMGDRVSKTLLSNDTHAAAMRQVMNEHYSQVMGGGDSGVESMILPEALRDYAFSRPLVCDGDSGLEPMILPKDLQDYDASSHLSGASGAGGVEGFMPSAAGFGSRCSCPTEAVKMANISHTDLNATALSAFAPGGGGVAASLGNLPQEVMSHAVDAVHLAGAGLLDALPFDSVPVRFLIVGAMAGAVITRKEIYRAKQKDAYLDSNLKYVGSKAREAAENTTRGFLTAAKKVTRNGVTRVAHILPARNSTVTQRGGSANDGLKIA